MEIRLVNLPDDEEVLERRLLIWDAFEQACERIGEKEREYELD
jgi:hypothetical protein